MKRVLLTVLVAVVLLLSLAGTVAAAPPADNPGNGPPDFDKIVFVHYPKGEAPGKPAGTPGASEGEYKLTKYHWADTSIPVTYLVNLGGMPDTFLAGVQAAFQTWKDDPLSYMDFTYGGNTSIGISSLANKMDYYNVVGWADISDKYPGAIAVTIFWYNVATKHLAEVDVAMNSNSSFQWWQEPAGETWNVNDTSTAYDVDVQNIMTHEAGHWLVLGDLYATYNSEKTMYGYSGEFELKKRSLTSGDLAGIQKIYPED
jgi:hypothetical protein